MPESSYKEWRLRKDDSEVYLSALIKSIVDAVERFALPYMNSLSTLSKLCLEIELHHVNLMRLDNIKWRILLYYIMGDKDMLCKTLENGEIGLHEKEVILYHQFIERCKALPGFI